MSNAQPGRSTLLRAHLNSLMMVAKPLEPWSVARTSMYSRCFSGHPYLFGVRRHDVKVQELLSEGRVGPWEGGWLTTKSTRTHRFPQAVSLLRYAGSQLLLFIILARDQIAISSHP